jgi:2-iminobutanoate/2-iminopropanoate deaminase
MKSRDASDAIWISRVIRGQPRSRAEDIEDGCRAPLDPERRMRRVVTFRWEMVTPSRNATLSWAQDWIPLFTAASYQEEQLMAKRVLQPPNLTFLPRPDYPYSPGTTAGGLVYTAGQVAWDERGELVGRGDPEAQTRQVLANVQSILGEGGATLDDVLKCNVYLADIRYFQAMNDVFAEFFPTEPPARTTVQAPLAEPEMLVEIEAIAWIGE